MTISLPLSNRPDVSFLIDDQDQCLISGHRWRLSANGYVMTSITHDGRRLELYLHRLILSPVEGFQVDHINHDKLDNRRANLRSVTPQQNSRNRRVLPSSRTGFIGVWPYGIRFSANLMVSGRMKHLGIYETAETAALVRDAYARLIDSEHFAMNFPDRPESPEITALLQVVFNPRPSRPRSVKRKSIYRGVSWDHGRWRATIHIGDYTLYLGLFDSEIDAAKAYDEAAKQYHGSHAHLNFADESVCETDLIATVRMDEMTLSLNAV